MKPIKIFALTLLILGGLSLVFGGFSYTKETTALKVGPVELTVKEKQTINTPLWLGIASIALGGALLIMSSKDR